MSVIEMPVTPKQEQLEGLKFSYEDVPNQGGVVIDYLGVKKRPSTKNPGHREQVDFTGSGVVIGCSFIEEGGRMVKVLRVQVLDIDIV